MAAARAVGSGKKRSRPCTHSALTSSAGYWRSIFQVAARSAVAPPSISNREDVARELIADLESAGIRQCVLAGHSLAGNVLPAMAELRPNLFRRLIYVSCSIPSTGQTVLELLGNRLHGSSEDEVGWPVDPKTTNVRDRYDAMFCEDMSETQRTKFLEQLGHDEWPQKFFSATRFTFDTLASIPATYVVCLKDRSLPVAWQEKFAARFHAQRLVRIDAGHQVMITRPHTLAEVLRHEVLV